MIVTWLLAPCVMPPLTCLKGKLVWLGKARGPQIHTKGKECWGCRCRIQRQCTVTRKRPLSRDLTPPTFPPKKPEPNLQQQKTTIIKNQNQTLQSQTFSTKLHSIIHHNLPWVLWIRLPATDPSLLWTCADWICSSPIFKTHPIPPLLIAGKVNSFITDR